MDDTLKTLLTLDGSRLRHYIDHKRLLTSTVFEEAFNEAIAYYKKFGDMTILVRLLGVFDGSKLKAVVLNSVCQATGLRGKMHESEVTFFKSTSEGDATFELKESLSKPSEKASKARLKRMKHSPQTSKGPKYPKTTGKQYDPNAPRGKTKHQLETPKKHWMQEPKEPREKPSGKYSSDRRPAPYAKSAGKYGDEKRVPYGKAAGKPAGRSGYGKSSAGDRPQRPVGAQPQGAQGGKPQRSYGDKPQRAQGGKPQRPGSSKPRFK